MTRTRPAPRSTFLSVLAVSLLLVGVLILLMVTWRGESTYAVDLRTELLEFSTGGSRNNVWALDGVRILDESGRERLFSGRVNLRDSVDVRVTRLGNGPVTAELRSQGAEPSVGTLYTLDDSILPAPWHLSITFPAENGQVTTTPVTLTFEGDLTEPDAPDRELGMAVAVLRSGEVQVLSKSILSGGVYVAMKHSLTPGDQVAVRRPDSRAFGILIVNEEPGLSASFRVIARSVQVVRPTGGEYTVSATLLQRVAADPAMIAALAVLLSLPLGALVWLYKKYRSFSNPKEAR